MDDKPLDYDPFQWQTFEDELWMIKFEWRTLDYEPFDDETLSDECLDEESSMTNLG